MMRRIAVLSLLSMSLALGPRPAAQPGGAVRVVVNRANPVSELSRAEVSRLFLKKTTRWDHGTKVLPVDQLPRSSVRIGFSQAIHRKGVDAVKSYWQAQTFSGVATAPPELASDAEVLSYLRSNSGAIGYVSRGAALGDGVKAVKISG